MKLGVNIDHVATLRQARHVNFPDPVKAATLAEQAGADSIVCHLREDRRHIQDMDLKLLKVVVKTRLNLEMAMSYEIIKIALEVKPDQVTFVPERREELTTEGGLDVESNFAKLKDVIEMFHSNKIRVSVFVNPDKTDIELCKKAGADIVEIHTGHYANAKSDSDKKTELSRIEISAATASKLGFFVAAGHGLDYDNVTSITKILFIEELNIGHSIVSHAVFVGLENAVKEMKRLCSY